MGSHRPSWFLADVFLFLAVFSGVGTPSSAAPVLITFEELSSGGAVIAQYANRGVTFNQLRARDYSDPGFFGANFAHSGKIGVEQCFAQEFCFVPIVATFTTPQRRVSAWVGYSIPVFARLTVVMTGLNAQGGQVAQSTTVFAAQPTVRRVNTQIEVLARSQSIARVEFVVRAEGSPDPFIGGLVVDDFEFDTEGPPPPCEAQVPPTIALDLPLNGTRTQIGSFLLGGTVTTPTNLTEARVTVTGSGGVSYTSDILATSLVQITGGRFGPTRFYPLYPGVNQIAVRMANCRDSRTVTRTVVSEPIPSGTRIILDHIEVTQSVQELDNLGNQRVELIADKRTIARLYMRTPQAPGTTISNVSATIVGRRLNGASPGGPFTLRSRDTMRIGPDPDPRMTARRGSLDGSLEFELPPEWVTQGALHLQVTRVEIEGVPTNLPCDNCENLNEFGLQRILRFNAAPPLRVELFNVPNRHNGVTHEVDDTHFDHLESWLLRAYPTARVLSTRRRIAPVSGVPDSDFEAKDINRRLALMRTMCSPTSFQFPPICLDTLGKKVHWYGMVPDDVDFMRGRARGIPGVVASGPAGCCGFSWDGDGSYADWYGGHELAHSYGRYHPGFCGESDDDDDYPYGGGSIGQHGFDVGDAGLSILMDVRPPGVWRDVMTYCTSQWISDYTYRGILSYLRSVSGGAGEEAEDGEGGGGAGAGAVLDDAILVQGEINLTRDDAELSPLFRLPSLVETEEPGASDFAIELRSAAGVVLARHLVELAEDTETEPGEDVTASFDLVAPWVEGTRRVVLLHGAREIASRAASANPPQVRLVSPNGPVVNAPNGVLTVVWAGSDPDGDRLTYTLLYSTDSGVTWEPIDGALEAEQLAINLSELRGGTQSMFRVIASDGFLTAVDDQDAPMVIASKAPRPRIDSPRDGDVVPASASIHLAGEAYDLEDGHLDGPALVWRVDGEGVVGTGPSISVADLEPGVHTIQLTAFDSDGVSGSTSVEIEVEEVEISAVATAETPAARGTDLVLDGRSSIGKAPLSYDWRLRTRPAGSSSAIRNASTSTPRLLLDVAGTYAVELRVTDAQGASASALLTIQSTTGRAFVRGRVTADESVDISDAVRMLGWLFLGEQAPTCLAAADTNDDDKVDLSDAVGLLSYLFLGGAPPVAPHPSCGFDPTPGTLGCDESTCP